jgi:hypothetical protein
MVARPDRARQRVPILKDQAMTPSAGRDVDNALTHAGSPWLCYWLVTPGNEAGYTPLQGFGKDVANPAFTALIELLAVLPASVFEIFAPPAELPMARAQLVRKQASIVGLPSFVAMQQRLSLDGVLQVVIVPSEIIDAAQACVRHSNTLFVSTHGQEGVLGLDDYEGHPAQLLDDAFHAVLLDTLPTAQRSVFEALPRRLPWPAANADQVVAGVTYPNALLARSLGRDLVGQGEIDAEQERAYERAIVASAAHCAQLIGEYSEDYILFSPSMLRQLYGFESRFWNRLMRAIPNVRVRRLLKDGLFRNKAYSGYVMRSEDLGVVDALRADPVAQGLVAMRQSELRATAAGVGALASSLLAPALRLPNAVNFHGAALRDIEAFAQRDDAIGKRRLQEVFAGLADRLYADIDEGIREIFADPAASLTLVSDAPVEWARVDGLPLMIRHEMSRISSTPGNLMLQQCIESSLTTIQESELYDVLILRSFAPDDPIATMLERGLTVFGLERVRTRFVNVATRQQVIDALNAFSGTLVVFDCHGGHGGAEGHGWLKIGEERLDTWSLAHIARIPPIVILSACSTFALAGSHASVGNGFLRSGAQTVIGTFLPVEAVRSTAFVSRLLYRVDAFLPALRSLGVTSLTWRTFVSGFLKMSYTTDILRYLLHGKAWISEEQYRNIGIAANHRINMFRPDWYAWLMERLAQATDRPEATIRAAITDEHPLMETLLYCQLGRPDALLVEISPMDIAPRVGA